MRLKSNEEVEMEGGKNELRSEQIFVRLLLCCCFVDGVVVSFFSLEALDQNDSRESIPLLSHSRRDVREALSLQQIKNKHQTTRQRCSCKGTFLCSVDTGTITETTCTKKLSFSASGYFPWAACYV